MTSPRGDTSERYLRLEQTHHHVGGSVLSRECDGEGWPADDEHPFVTPMSRSFAVDRPVDARDRVALDLYVPTFRPFVGERISSSGAAVNQDGDGSFGAESIEGVSDELSVGELPSSGDEETFAEDGNLVHGSFFFRRTRRIFSLARVL